MDDIFVARLMSADPVTVSPDTLVEEAANIMMDNDIGSVIVTDEDGHLDGILTSTDFVKIVAECKPKDQTPVSEYMTRDVITTTAGAEIAEIADVMLEHAFHHVPVVDETEGLIGIITTTDLTDYIAHVDKRTAA